jgi:hypothetical protein
VEQTEIYDQPLWVVASLLLNGCYRPIAAGHFNENLPFNLLNGWC